MPWEFDFCFSYSMLIVEHACWQPMTNYKNLFIVKKKKKKTSQKGHDFTDKQLYIYARD
jgi:hypothetical protein